LFVFSHKKYSRRLINSYMSHCSHMEKFRSLRSLCSSDTPIKFNQNCVQTFVFQWWTKVLRCWYSMGV